MKKVIAAFALFVSSSVFAAAPPDQKLFISIPYLGTTADVYIDTYTSYSPYLDSVHATTMTVTLTNLQSMGSLYVLNQYDYDRLKELQYLNVFKGILVAPDSLFVTKSTSTAEISALRQRIISYCLDNDPFDYFSTPWLKANVLTDLAVSTQATGGGK